MTADAFAETYRLYFRAVRARSRRLLRDGVAEDVAQETFVRLWRSGLALDEIEPRALLGWLYRTCTRLSIDALGQQARPHVDVDALPARTPELERQLDARASLARLAAGARAEDLEAILLVRAEGEPQAEAAAELAISERTLRRRLARFDARFAGRAVAAVVFVLVAIASARSCAAAPARGVGAAVEGPR